MTKLLIFGGTSEGRILATEAGQLGIPCLLLVATEYGEALIAETSKVRVLQGRLDQAAMQALLDAEQPQLVIDATHPYALQVSAHLRAACQATGSPLIRLVRACDDLEGLVQFADMDALVSWLNTRDQGVFSTLGAKEAISLSRVDHYQDRVWLRILPFEESLSTCLASGFPAQHIICMQGPFSRELNRAMFRASGAGILLTKASGKAGGFAAKLEAAQDLGLQVAVLARPQEEQGLSLSAIQNLLRNF